MNRTQHSLCNDVLAAPTGVKRVEVRALAITRNNYGDTQTVTSYWKPSAAELATLVAGGCVTLEVMGVTMPPVRLGAIE